MQSGMPRCSTARDRQEAVAEVRLGRRARADPRAGGGEQVELVAVGVRGVHDRRAGRQAALAVEQLDRPERRARPGTRRSRAPARRRGCAAAARARRRSGRARPGPAAGQARTEWGATPTRIPSPRSVSSSREVRRPPSPAGTAASRRAGSRRRGRRTRSRLPQPPRPRPEPRRARGSGTRRPRCSRRCGARGRPRRTRAGSRRRSATRRARSSRRARPRSRRPARYRAAPAGTRGSARRRSPGTARVRGTPRRYVHPAYPFRRMASRTVSAPLAQLPNALTIARLALIPVYVVLILTCDNGRSWAAALVFGVAGVTDQIDGYLARRWHVESGFGKIADPLADRLMIGLAVILIWHAGRLPWAALAIPLRDIVVLVGTPIAIRRGYDFQVNMMGKAATWLLYLSVGCVMVHPPGRALAAVDLLGRLRARGHLAAGLRGEGQARGDGVKAVVMAGGEGTRLRPLTSNQPKPMVPIVGKPCMEHILELLRSHGFEDVLVTVAFMPQAIRSYFGSGREPRHEHRVLGRGEPARHGRLGAPRQRPARRHLPRHLRRRALRLRPLEDRRVPPREGRRGHDRPQVGREPARVRDRRDRRGRARRALPREAVVGAGVLGHDQHGHLRDRARGAAPRPGRRAVRLLEGAVPAPARDGAARSTASSATGTGRTSATSTSTGRPTSTRSTRR